MYVAIIANCCSLSFSLTQNIDVKALPTWMAVLFISASFLAPACVIVLYSVKLWRMTSKDEQRIKREQEDEEEVGKLEVVEAEKKAVEKGADGLITDKCTQPRPRRKYNEAQLRKGLYTAMVANWVVLTSNLMQTSSVERAFSWSYGLVVFSLVLPVAVIAFLFSVVWRMASKDQQRIKREQEEEEEEGKLVADEKVAVSEPNEVVSEKC